MATRANEGRALMYVCVCAPALLHAAFQSLSVLLVSELLLKSPPVPALQASSDWFMHIAFLMTQTKIKQKRKNTQGTAWNNNTMLLDGYLATGLTALVSLMNGRTDRRLVN